MANSFFCCIFAENINNMMKKEYQRKNDLRQIEIGLTNDEDTYIYYIKVFDNGSSSIDVQSRQRESISYSGEMIWP